MKIEDKSRGVLTKLLIFHLLIAIEYQTWYHIKAKTQSVLHGWLSRLSNFNTHEN